MFKTLIFLPFGDQNWYFYQSCGCCKASVGLVYASFDPGNEIVSLFYILYKQRGKGSPCQKIFWYNIIIQITDDDEGNHDGNDDADDGADEDADDDADDDDDDDDGDADDDSNDDDDDGNDDEVYSVGCMMKKSDPHVDQCGSCGSN